MQLAAPHVDGIKKNLSKKSSNANLMTHFLIKSNKIKCTGVLGPTGNRNSHSGCVY